MKNENLSKIIDLVSKTNPLQKKKILAFIENQDCKSSAKSGPIDVIS